MKNLNKILLILVIFITSSLALAKIYFLPNDAKSAKKEITSLIKNAKTSVDIAMYNFSYKKFNKALVKATKRDVAVTLIYGKTKLKLSKNFKLIQTKNKQHIKLAIIDNHYVIFGSANWTKESFSENYEIINIIDDKEKVQKFIKIFKQLKEEN